MALPKPLRPGAWAPTGCEVWGEDAEEGQDPTKPQGLPPSNPSGRDALSLLTLGEILNKIALDCKLLGTGLCLDVPAPALSSDRQRQTKARPRIPPPLPVHVLSPAPSPPTTLLLPPPSSFFPPSSLLLLFLLLPIPLLPFLLKSNFFRCNSHTMKWTFFSVTVLLSAYGVT